jgi:drug/metabolite transporter (DMT)-like permease
MDSWIWYHLVRKGELISLNSLTLLTPVFALLLALLIYREPLSKSSMVGIAMVLGSVVWVGWPMHGQQIEKNGNSKLF